MDSETSNNISKMSSKMRILTIIISAINEIISVILFLNAWNIEKDFRNFAPIIWVVMILNAVFCATNLKLLNAVWSRNVNRIKYCLEVFILLIIFNIIPMTMEDGSKKYSCSCIKGYSDYTPNTCDVNENILSHFVIMWSICKIYFVFIVLEIYFVYRYYDYELKCSRQNISPELPLCINPSAPIEHNQMVTSHNTTQQSEQCSTQPPVQYIFQPTGHNPIHQAGQKATQQPIQYIIQQPGQYTNQQPEQHLTQLPVTLAYNPSHIVQVPLQPDQSLTTKPEQDLNLKSGLSITQKSVKLTCNPPPYSRSEDF